MTHFSAYTKDPNVISQYVAYQSRYATNARESDKVFVSLLQEIGASGSLVDVGCSTGNLLKVIHAARPDLALTGVDLSEQQIEVCKADPELTGIDFRASGFETLPRETYDVAITSATLYGFDDPAFQRNMQMIWQSLKPGGVAITFEYYHPFPQDIHIVERSKLFPFGNPLHMRSYETAAQIVTKVVGFDSVEFRPFEIPIDLAPSNENPIQTRTLKTEGGTRIMLRGAIAQPWCYMIARKG